MYDYTARYTAGATRFLCPAELDDDIAQRCSALALRVHDVWVCVISPAPT